MSRLTYFARVEPDDPSSPRASQRHGRMALTYLPFILNGSITALTELDFLGFGLPIDSPSPGPVAVVGKGKSSGALARVVRVRHARDAADVVDLHWGGGARWFGSAAGGSDTK